MSQFFPCVSMYFLFPVSPVSPVCPFSSLAACVSA